MNFFEQHLKKIFLIVISIPVIVIILDEYFCLGLARYWPPVGTSFIFLVVLFAYNLNKKLKRIDVEMKCQERFEKLQFEVLPKAKEIRGGEISYYKRYWTLQFEQFQYYTAGFISSRIYWAWLVSNHDRLYSDQPFENLGYLDSWESFREGYKKLDETFVALIDSVNAKNFPADSSQLKEHIEVDPISWTA